MTRHMLRTFGALLLLVSMLSGNVSLAAADRDPLASVKDMEAPRFATVPPDLFLAKQRQDISLVVDEARVFGVPLVVRAISVPTRLDLLPGTSMEGVVPTAEQLTQRMAEEWLATEVVESSPGAGDGILLLVVVPEDDHRQSTAAFATGDNALPLNGLTQERLDRVLNEVIKPFFAANAIGPGIRTGIAYLSYDNLFAVPPRLQPTVQQEKLQTLTNTYFAGLTGLSAVALMGLVLWIRGRDLSDTPADTPPLSAFEAGALTRGKADEAVVTAALLHLMRTGALVMRGRHRGAFGLSVNLDVPVNEPFAHQVLQRLVAEADDAGHLTEAGTRRLQDVLMPARGWLEDRLAHQGLFNRDAKVETVWVILASAGVVALALFSLFPAMTGMSGISILAIGVAILTVIGALVWVARRSWTTRAGRAALETWRATPHEMEELAIFDTIIYQDALLAAPGGPVMPSAIRTVRELRSLGAG